LRLPFFGFLVILAAPGLYAATSAAPVLQWYQSISGSGASTAVSVATDPQGNLYIAGNTASLDLPTVAAAQKQAGGSPLIRIDTTSGSSQKLYSSVLSAANNIAVDPENSQILYVAAGGTLSRSADGGNTWTALPSFPTVSRLNSVTVDPANSSTLYAAISQLGAFKSIDGGATWTAINNGIPTTSNEGTDIYGHLAIITSVNAYQIWVDPRSPGSVFASSDKGLFRSSDGGATWTLSLSIASFRGSLAFDPFTSGTIYAQGNKSSDEGLTWTPFSSPGGPIVPDPFHQGNLYVAGTYNAVQGLYQSTDGGASWNLKVQGQVQLVTADPKQPVFYAYLPQAGIIRSGDGFNSYSKAALVQTQFQELQVAGSNLFALAAVSTDVFVAKLDPGGNVLYSTYFGGSASDSAAGMVVGTDGSVYITGQTASVDFPVTPRAYSTALSGIRSNFAFKLNPDGSLAWSTYFADSNSTVNAIALDSAGNPYLAGTTYGSLPTTPGAYQTQFIDPNPCVPGNIGPCFPPTEAFLTKFDSQGSTLLFSTYISNDLGTNELGIGSNVLAVNSTGAYVAGGNGVVLMNSTGSQLLAFQLLPVSTTINAMSLDAGGNLYATGTTNNSVKFPATPGAFQASPRPGSSGVHAFVVKLDSALSQVHAATLLGGESTDVAQSVAIDASSGNIFVGGYTDSLAFPTRGPFQASFAARSGFVAGFDPALSQLLFSTYVGDARPFSVAGAVPDGNGNLLLAGSTLTPVNGYLIDDPGFPFTVGASVIANKIALPPAPSVRLDSVVNFASGIAAALSPGEAIAANGAGFGPDSQLFLDGTPLPLVSVSPNRVVAVIPTGAPTSGTRVMSVSSAGTASNPILLPSATASPGIYSMDGSGVGQGYIRNADGALNSPSNPASTGSAITILVTGVGQVATTGGYTVTSLPVAVFVDGFYANGIGASVQQVTGQPGSVYEISVYVPDPVELAAQNPDLNNFTFPPEIPVTIFVGAVSSQNGIELSVKQ
jgi:uncharacterized protein (TIGR03437 family)